MWRQVSQLADKILAKTTFIVSSKQADLSSRTYIAKFQIFHGIAIEEFKVGSDDMRNRVDWLFLMYSCTYVVQFNSVVEINRVSIEFVLSEVKSRRHCYPERFQQLAGNPQLTRQIRECEWT